MLLHGGGCLEQHYFSTYMFGDVVSRLNRLHKAGFCTLWSMTVHEVVLEVFKESKDEVVAVLKIDQQVIGLGEESISSVGNDHHLGLFQGWSQIEIVKILIVRDEAHFHSVSARKASLLNYSLDCMRSLLEIA
jgi:hypothetical protein